MTCKLSVFELSKSDVFSGHQIIYLLIETNDHTFEQKSTRSLSKNIKYATIYKYFKASIFGIYYNNLPLLRPVI